MLATSIYGEIMTNMHHVRRSRRAVLAGLGGMAAVGALHGSMAAQEASPAASPQSGEWTYTDVLGNVVTLPARPVRIAANLVTAAALWDLGIRPVAVFDWTASAFPDGGHVAWGNVDPAAVANIGDVDGNILPEDLLNVEPDLILTLTFDPSDPTQTAGIAPDLADRIGQVAPVIVVTDMASTAVQLERLVQLGTALGADLAAPEIADARASYEAKVSEFEQVAAAKGDLTSLFMNFDADAIYAGGPGGIAELEFLGSLGLVFANADSPEAGAFWETLSAEEAMKYPSDIVYSDVYSSYLTAEDLQAQPVFAAMPAVEAGQVGLWNRDFPVNYAGIEAFLETILETLRTAEKVTG
jgi:iron complex transport system substrate-binding protein